MITITNQGGQGIVQGAPDYILKALTKTFSIENPMWHKLQRMGKTKALWACPKEFRYYGLDKISSDLVLPRGSLERTMRNLKSQHVPFVYKEDLSPLVALPPKYFKRVPIMRDYQEGYVERIVEESKQNGRCGILRLDTGWGKTLLGLELARRLNLQTIIIVRGLTELDQWKSTAKTLMGTEIGVVQGKHADKSPVVVATAQTLSNRPDYLDYVRSNYPVVLIDECHTFTGNKRRKLIQSLKPTYLYGLTATDRRTDGQGEAISFLVGEKVAEGSLPKETPTVEVKAHQESYHYTEYSELVGCLTTSTRRNLLITTTAQHERRTGRNIIILCKRRAHCDLLLQSFIELDMPSVYIDAKDPREFRSSLFAKLKERQSLGILPIVLGTYSLLATGFDLPALDTLILAGDLRSDVLQEQSEGRVRRVLSGKATPKIIDIWDTGDAILKSQGKSRQKFYKERGWNFTIV